MTLTQDRWDEVEPEYDPCTDDKLNRPVLPKKPKKTERSRRNRRSHYLIIMKAAHDGKHFHTVRSHYDIWCGREITNECPPPPPFHEIIIAFNEDTWKKYF